MDSMLFLYSIGLWLIFLVLAIVNGTIRNSIYAPKVGQQKGHVISSVIAICYTLTVTYFLVNFIKPAATLMDLLLIGAFWLTITVFFEFGFGHYVIGHSWKHLINDYNILKGRIWSLVLLTTFVAPILWGYVLGLS